MKNGLQIVNFRNNNLTEMKYFQKEQEQTIKHYLMGSQFKLDVLCLLPTDLLYIIQTHINPIVRLNRVLKVLFNSIVPFGHPCTISDQLFLVSIRHA